jgi:cell wall-associated NlpC family hydrolase
MRLRAFATTCLAVAILLTGTEAALATTTSVAPEPTTAPLTAAQAPGSLAESTLAETDPTSTPELKTGPTATSRTTMTTTTTPPPTLAAAPARVPASAVVVAFARSHLRAHYRHSATGPSSFDCSGLMWRVFKEAGLGTKVTSRSARGIYVSYKARGLTSKTKPQVGDLIIWGQGSHVGVYIGKGLAISALVQGVRVHRVRAMFTPFTAYLHTHLASILDPAWELQLAQHAKSARHTTRTTALRTAAGASAASLGSLRSGVRFVVLASRRDGSGHLWYKALTFSGRTGWIRATASVR